MKLRKYILPCEENNYRYDTFEKEGCKCYSINMEEIVKCANCECDIVFGDSYTSKRWYEQSGFFGMPVCKKCHEEEWIEINVGGNGKK